jgi:hypothetical protein
MHSWQQHLSSDPAPFTILKLKTKNRAASRFTVTVENALRRRTTAPQVRSATATDRTDLTMIGPAALLAVLRIAGDDAARFLQGQLTHDTGLP